MEYYAKSKKRRLTEKEKEILLLKIESLVTDIGGELETWEMENLQKVKCGIRNDSEETAKTVREHLEETVACAEAFFQLYGKYFSEVEKELVVNACRYHDLGKLNLVFQKKVNPYEEENAVSKGQKQIPHGYLSAVSISKKSFLKLYPNISEDDFYVMITAIYYHHTREDEFDSQQIKMYCEKYYNAAVKQYLGKEDWKIRSMNCENLLFRNSVADVNLAIPDKIWNKYLLVKGLLNKFDWAVSAGYETAEEKSDLVDKKLKNAIEQKMGDNLRPAQIYMREHKDENLVITAPTGSGKTEAALLWMDGEKSFYTLPLKVSSNAIYDRIKKQYEYQDVSLLHSDSMVKYFMEKSEDKAKDGETAEEDGYSRYEKAKLLSGPITICTVDQLFKFVYKALGTEIFPATLKYSKLVLDEIQAYSPRVVASILYGLKTITAMGGRFAIITATFPPVLGMFMAKYGLVEGKDYQFKDFAREADSRRHIVEVRDGELDIEEIADMGTERKVLVICNTVKKAQMIYGEISDLTEDVFLLHSRFIRKDRAILEDAIMKFSRNLKATGIWVTTQIVEASLDIDFDILYTEMAPADSLLQRMGRCNRAQRYEPTEANIIVFDNESGVSAKNTGVYNMDLYKRSVDKLKQYEYQVFTERDKADYIDAVYNPDEIKDTSYYQEIEKYMAHFAEVNPLEYTIDELKKKGIRDINSITVVPDSVKRAHYSLFDECSALIREPHIGVRIKSILRAKMNDYTLSLNLNNYRYPEGVDHVTICGTDIHMANLVYEFDANSRKGRGLLMEKKSEEDFLEC